MLFEANGGGGVKSGAPAKVQREEVRNDGFEAGCAQVLGLVADLGR